MSEEKNIEPLIVLELDTGERGFTDLEDFREWAQNEQQAFTWLSELSGQDSNAAQAWTTTSSWFSQLNSFLQQYEQHKDNEQQKINLINTLKNQTQQAIQNQHLKTSESADAQFIFSLRESQSAVIAGYGLIFLMHMNVNSTTRPALEGVFWAAQYLQGNTETIEAQKKPLKR